MRIHILGAAGTGTTSVGKFIASKFNLKHIESDYYAWRQTDPPFSEYLDINESKALLEALFKNEPNFIISGSLARWGKTFGCQLDLVVFLTSPTRLRLKRLRQREKLLHGARIEKGGDMYLSHKIFLQYAKNYYKGDLSHRSYALHKHFLQNDIRCPVIKISTNQDMQIVQDKVCNAINQIIQCPK